MVLDATGLVATVKLTRSEAAGTVTLAGMVATAVSELCSVTTAPPEGADPSRTTVPVDRFPPVTSSGSRKKELTRVAAGVARTVNCLVTVVAPSLAEIVTTVSAETAWVWMPTPALLLPCVNVTSGCAIDAADGLLLDTVIVALAISGAGAT